MKLKIVLLLALVACIGHFVRAEEAVEEDASQYDLSKDEEMRDETEDLAEEENDREAEEKAMENPEEPEIDLDELKQKMKDAKPWWSRRRRRRRKATLYCPHNYPYAYMSGKYCCAYNKEKKSWKLFGNAPCNGGPISWASNCCYKDAHISCTGGICTNYPYAWRSYGRRRRRGGRRRYRGLVANVAGGIGHGAVNVVGGVVGGVTKLLGGKHSVPGAIVHHAGKLVTGVAHGAVKVVGKVLSLIPFIGDEKAKAAADAKAAKAAVPVKADTKPAVPVKADAKPAVPVKAAPVAPVKADVKPVAPAAPAKKDAVKPAAPAAAPAAAAADEETADEVAMDEVTMEEDVADDLIADEPVEEKK